MLATGTQWMLQWVPISLFSLLANVYAQPCARIYMQELDSTTTVYPQLAGVYKLHAALLSDWVSTIGADQQYFVIYLVNYLVCYRPH